MPDIMKTAYISNDLFDNSSPLGSQLSRPWMRWAVFFFLVASLFGLLMRYYFVGGASVLEYKHVLHAHSHSALLGWGFLLVSGVLVFTFVKDPSRAKTYHFLLLTFTLANIGMMSSFPFQGYGLYSILFSTLHLVAGYVFAYHFLKDLSKYQNSTATRLVKFSIYWMLISSIGLWAIAPIGATLGKLHPLYYLSVQWFLHFQINGWFVYAMLGILAFYLEIKGKALPLSLRKETVLHISLFLTYALVLFWSTGINEMLYFNSAGVTLQALAYYWFLRPVQIHLFPHKISDWTDKILLLGVLSLVVKAIIQIALIIPEVATVSLSIRMYVIGFIHLVMMGAITFGIGAYALKRGWLKTGKVSVMGWKILALGFLITEILLLGQGTLLWGRLGFIPYYHLLLFISSILFPLALLLILVGMGHKKILDKNRSQIKKETKTQILTNKHTMKSSMLFSLGVVILLMTGCGGGSSSENQGSYTPPSAGKTESAADPKGIGEVRSVDLGEDVDEVMAAEGKAVVDMKCTACHQLNDKRVVGPGFEGVTNRRRPEWIMNMITNVDVMLDEDPVARELLEECLTRMPNQNISIAEARNILEFFRQNDEERTGTKDGALN